MFWIGLIIGILVGIVLGVAGNVMYALYHANMSFEEAAKLGDLMIDASHNRECSITVVKNDEIVDEVVLEEK